MPKCPLAIRPHRNDHAKFSPKNVPIDLLINNVISVFFFLFYNPISHKGRLNNYGIQTSF